MSQALQDRVAAAQSEANRKRISASFAWILENLETSEQEKVLKALNWAMENVDMQVLSGERRLVAEKIEEARFWWKRYLEKNPAYVPLTGVAGGEKSLPQP